MSPFRRLAAQKGYEVVEYTDTASGARRLMMVRAFKSLITYSSTFGGINISNPAVNTGGAACAGRRTE
jgi:hypothetical protein